MSTRSCYHHSKIASKTNCINKLNSQNRNCYPIPTFLNKPTALRMLNSREREKTKRKRKSRSILTIWRTPGIPGCLSWGLYLARMFRNPIARARSGPARISGSKGNDCPPFFKAAVRRPWEDWEIGGGGLEVSEAGGRSGWGRRSAVAPPAAGEGSWPTSDAAYSGSR